jgi:hypothetical protein
MSVDQQAGLLRADLTGLAYTYAQPNYKKKSYPIGLASVGRTYRNGLCSKDWEEAPVQLWRGGHSRVGMLPSP